ncbi:MAG TPA: helix-turn-helix domain-containing protein [Rhabdochlamydiaceae bacterium]|nr:helix-turn-helix domain-containing protein [Rhabdochlamydiaceae bacterium]
MLVARRKGERNIALENIVAIAKALKCSPKDIIPD